MPTTIDGLLGIGAFGVSNVNVLSIAPGDNTIGRMKIQDESGAGPAATVKAGELSVAAEAPPGAGGSTAVNGSTAVGLAATQIVAGMGVNVTRKYVTITNPETTDPTNILWVGAAGITPGTGIPVYPGETFEDTEGQDAWFGVFATAGLTVPWFQVTVP